MKNVVLTRSAVSARLAILLVTLFLMPTWIGCSTGQKGVFRSPASEVNRLRPFTTDGCSRFPDGIPYVNSEKWLHCCIEHDIAYWQGGEKELRELADQRLEDCVSQAGDPAIARAMFFGVWAGGSPRLPTPWRWGYGWVRDRGYSKLTPEEYRQVERLLELLPADWTEIPIQ